MAHLATTEEKVDSLAAQMNSMLKLIETFNRWSPEVDKFSTELSKNLKDLTLLVEALEAQPPTAPPLTPKCEEEVRAMGHDVAHPL